jgi:hypothetical protein
MGIAKVEVPEQEVQCKRLKIKDIYRDPQAYRFHFGTPAQAGSIAALLAWGCHRSVYQSLRF